MDEEVVEVVREYGNLTEPVRQRETGASLTLDKQVVSEDKIPAYVCLYAISPQGRLLELEQVYEDSRKVAELTGRDWSKIRQRKVYRDLETKMRHLRRELGREDLEEQVEESENTTRQTSTDNNQVNHGTIILPQETRTKDEKERMRRLYRETSSRKVKKELLCEVIRIAGYTPRPWGTDKRIGELYLGELINIYGVDYEEEIKELARIINEELGRNFFVTLAEPMHRRTFRRSHKVGK